MAKQTAFPGPVKRASLQSSIFYAGVLAVAALCFWAIVSQATSVEQGRFLQFTPAHLAGDDAADSFVKNAEAGFQRNLAHPISRLFLQIILIVGLARIAGALFRKFRQPSVIGEIAVGIALGPSLLGWIWPDAYAFVFAKDAIGSLQLLSQIGLVLFMFIVGMELNMKSLIGGVHAAVVISHASIVIPFVLGMGLSLLIYSDHAPPNVSFVSFSLFMGIAMSITAFPVLARIIQERDLGTTRLGSIALAAAAADDVTAWSLLAAVVAVARTGSAMRAIPVALFAAGFVALSILLIRPLLARLGQIYVSRANLTIGVVVLVFVYVFASAFATEIIGIHALFGAFLAGAMMPSSREFRALITEKIHDVSVYLLLPLFFAFSGLRTQLGVLNSSSAWGIAALVIAVAVAGKFAGSTLAARVVGESWKDSLSVGALMNTRGLMELIALNIGYDLGILSPEMFSIMVLMALVTTFMTGPSLDLLDRLFKPARDSTDRTGGTLIAFARPKGGMVLLRLAHVIGGNKPLTAAHFSALQGYADADFGPGTDQELQKLSLVAGELGAPLEVLRKESDDVARDLLQQAHARKPDIILLGAARSVFSSDVLGGVVKDVVNGAECPVGIVVDRGIEEITRILVVVTGSPNDVRLLTLLEPAGRDGRARITLMSPHPTPELEGRSDGFESVPWAPSRFSAYSLVALPSDAWRALEQNDSASFLIVNF